MQEITLQTVNLMLSLCPFIIENLEVFHKIHTVQAVPFNELWSSQIGLFRTQTGSSRNQIFLSKEVQKEVRR